MPRRFACASVLLLSPLLAACGGGSGGESRPEEPKQFSVPALATFGLGTVYQSGYVALLPEQPYVGDRLSDELGHGFFSFSLDGLTEPDLAACRLRLTASIEYGNAEASPMHGFVADAVDIGTGLDAGDFAVSAALPPSPRAARIPVAPGTYAYEFDVAQHVRAALLGGQSRVTLRVRVLGTSDMDGQPDGLLLHVADPGFASLHPTLEVTRR